MDSDQRWHLTDSWRFMKLPYLLSSILLLSSQITFAQQFTANDLAIGSQTNIESKFSIQEIDEFDPNTSDDAVFLENGYARSAIINPESWQKLMNANRAVKINLIYTKYPRNKELWRTNYRGLMMDRLKALFAIDSSLNSSKIEWNIVLQTKCRTEPEAIKMLHGIEIVFEPLPVTTEVAELSDTLDPSAPSESINDPENLAYHERKLSKMVKRVGGHNNTTVQTILERNSDWKNALVVMDWSGSMYPYSLNLMLWHARNFQKSGITNVVLFTDGEPGKKKGNLGNYGGIYYSPAADLKSVVKIMGNTWNKNFRNSIEENNIEGLFKGAAHFPEHDELIMIADNRSCMKDFCLCELVNSPVRIVLCGTEDGINPQYVNLAYRLNGSLHTLESDMQGFESYKIAGNDLVIDGWEFIYNPKLDRFEEKNTKNGQQLGYQDCEKFYRINGKCRKVIERQQAAQ